MRISPIRRVLLALAVLGTPLVLEQEKTARSTFVIAVNPANKFRNSPSIIKNSIRRFYLKEWTTWPDGSTVRAFGRKPGSTEQETFRRQILSMTSAQIARHWLSKKNQHGLAPPKAVSSDRLMIKYVKKYPGAFAILRRKLAQKHGLRILMPL